MSRIIQKKTLPEYFESVLHRDKNFELRKDEDSVQVGDCLVLEEWDETTGKYTGRALTRTVTYVLRNVPEYGLVGGYCIIGFK